MKNIIIIGVSKAGRLHLQSYNKLKEKGEIFLVDNQKEDNDLKIYKTIEEVLNENKLDSNDVVVDICTPKEVFYQIIDECINLNIKNILVEKPFILKKQLLENHNELKIIMIQNYLYSKIVEDMKKYILENKLEVKAIYTNFSKNRTEESFNGRGMYKKVTRNIEHDIPHQVYITQYLLGKTEKTELLFKEEKSMIRGDVELEKHGYSKIISKKDDVIVTHESDFSTNTKIREIIVVCDNNIVVKGEFLFYDGELNKTKNGSIEILQNNKVIEKRIIDYDDNMYECLFEIYSYFNKNEQSVKYREEILEFSKEMNLYMN